MTRRKDSEGLKHMKGTASKGSGKGTPEPELSWPEMPMHLAGEAVAEWERVTAELDSLGILFRVDRAAIAAYCSLWAEYVEAEKVLETDGLTIKTSGREGATMVRKHPAVSVKNESLRLMRGYLGEFGLSPSARTKVDIRQPRRKPDGLAELFKRREALAIQLGNR